MSTLTGVYVATAGPGSGGGGSSSALLASNNVWTGTNQFDNTVTIGSGVAKVVVTSGATDVTYSNTAGAGSNTAHSFSQPVSVNGRVTCTSVSNSGSYLCSSFSTFVGVNGGARVTFENGFSTTTLFFQMTAGRSRVANNVTNVTTTPANITGLSATVRAGRFYTGEVVLYCDSATAADGLRFDFDGGTATMTAFIVQGTIADDVSVRPLARTTALATDITDTTSTGSCLVVFKFYFTCNAAGTFIPRFAKEADAAGATATVTAGSYMWMEDTP